MERKLLINARVCVHSEGEQIQLKSEKEIKIAISQKEQLVDGCMQ
jgi:hypothetical protein